MKDEVKIQPAFILDYPDYLKDHVNFEKVQRAILDAGATKHSHAEMIDWHNCKACQQKGWDRKEMMRKLGFKDGRHYLNWYKIHKQIDEMKRDPLVNWKNESN